MLCEGWIAIKQVVDGSLGVRHPPGATNSGWHQWLDVAGVIGVVQHTSIEGAVAVEGIEVGKEIVNFDKKRH